MLFEIICLNNNTLNSYVFFCVSHTENYSFSKESLLKSYNYKAFGLNIESAIKCPELLSGTGIPDVSIRLGKIPEKFVENKNWEHFWRATPDYFFFSIKAVGKYLVTAGDTILVENHSEAITSDLKVFLLGTCFGVILHQRGILPIHGSGVVVNNAGVIFSGEMGAGKSTLAASFMNRGARIIADDVCAISFTDKGQSIIHPGSAQIKLCLDVAPRFNITADGGNRVSSYSDKLRLPIADDLQRKPLPVSSIYFLDKHEQMDITIRELTGREKFLHVSKNTYRKSLISDLSMDRTHFRNSSSLAGKVRMYKVLRPEAGSLNDDLVNCVERHLRLS